MTLERGANVPAEVVFPERAPFRHYGLLPAGSGCHEFHVILDALGPDGIWVGVAPPGIGTDATVGDPGCGWALHSDGDKRWNGREDEFSQVCGASSLGVWVAGAGSCQRLSCH